MLPTQPQCPKHQRLAREVHNRQHMRKQTQLVQTGVRDSIRAVNANHTRQDRVDAEETRSQRRDLVLGRQGGLCLLGGGRGGENLGDGVGAGGGVGDEEAVVDAACVVEGEQVGEGVAYGCDGGLGGSVRADFGCGSGGLWYQEKVAGQVAILKRG